MWVFFRAQVDNNFKIWELHPSKIIAYGTQQNLHFQKLFNEGKKP